MSEEVKLCIDKILPEEARGEAIALAIQENPANSPLMAMRVISNLVGEMPSPNEIALFGFNMWQPGRTIRVRFLDGIPVVQQKVEKYAHEWEKYANIKFEFGNDLDAEIRISFKQQGSWSFLGTQCLSPSIPKDQPTMNYGWLTPDTLEDEYSRVVLHEFGHALGCIHEHQHPESGIPWNEDAVYNHFTKCPNPPHNCWSKEQVDTNFFEKYSRDMLNSGKYDVESIMHYDIPKQFVNGVFTSPRNTVLSERDKQFIKLMYPFTEDALPNNEMLNFMFVGQPAANIESTMHY